MVVRWNSDNDNECNIIIVVVTVIAIEWWCDDGGVGWGEMAVMTMTTTMVVIEATKARCSGDDGSGRMVVEAKMAGW